MNEAELFKGRKGKKKREALEKQLQMISDEFDNKYLHTREMKYIEENVKWSLTSRLVFAMGERRVYIRWKGFRDYGFIRLCAQWFESNRVYEPTADQVMDMLKDVLPEEEYIKLSEEIKTLEII